MRALLAAAGLVAVPAFVAPALASAPEAWPTGQWPDADAIVLHREVTVDLTDPAGSRTTERTVTGVVHGDRARRADARVSVVERPGCREVEQLSVEVKQPGGAVFRSELAEVVWSPLGDHPLEPARSTREGTVPRRGIVDGAVIEEVRVIFRSAACFEGSVHTQVRFGAERPILEERVTVVGGAPELVLDDPTGTVQAGDAAWTRSQVDPLPDEQDRPARAQHQPRLFVSVGGTAAIAGLRALLDAEADRRAGTVADVAAKAKKAYPSIDDEAERLAVYVARKLELLDADSEFWTFGFEWGERTRLAERPLLPMEWWAVAWAVLRKHGAVPLLYDRTSLREPVATGNVYAFQRVGFRVPGVGVVLPDRWFEESGGSVPALAGKWALLLEEQGPTALGFVADAAVERVVYEGGARLNDDGDELQIDVLATATGSKAARLDKVYRRLVEAKQKKAKKKPKKKGASSAPPKPSAKKTLGLLSTVFDRDIIKGGVTLGEPDSGEAKAVLRWLRPVPTAKAKRSKVIALPLPVDLPADVLGLSDLPDDRALDVVLAPRTDVYSLRIKDPAGTRPAGLPESVEVAEGPVTVSAVFTRDEETAEIVAEVEIAVGGPVIPAAEAPALREAVRALHRLDRLRLLYEPE